MSNLIRNGDFSLPVVTTGAQVTWYTAFNAPQLLSFVWVCSGGSVGVINGYRASWPDPSTIGYTQFALFSGTSSIQQSFNVNTQGSYILTFYYSSRSGYPFDNLQINVNGVLFDTLPSPSLSASWVKYTNTVILNTGSNTISFLGTITTGFTTIAGISFTSVGVSQTLPTNTQTPSTNQSSTTYYNPVTHNKTTNSIFNKTDWLINSNDAKYVNLNGSSMTGSLSTVGLTSTGGMNQFMSNLTLPTTYPTIPSKTQIGGSITVNYTPASAVNSTITNIVSITLPVGIWFLNYRIGFKVLTGTGNVSTFIMALSSRITTLDASTRLSKNKSASISASGLNNEVGNIGNYFVSLNNSQTYYLNYYATCTGNIQVNGYVTAIRIA